ncbi:MAG: hypothetical protein EOP63_03925 [Sphingomonadales bacterium]|nr:MAG: hypothetical protein EOP63_03925 [Sphingomonadales bacterium]
MKAGGVAPHAQPVLSTALVVQATRRWCGARQCSLPGGPALHRLFAPLGFFMMAASFDSLMLLVEHAAGRPLLAGLADQPTRDQRGIDALLATGQLAAAEGWLDFTASRCPLAGAIDCAIVSVRLAAVAPDPTAIVS